ncbi:hypothetical protein YASMINEVIRUS_661 [Yasminevirus sp. GU-2018]|uniref:Uncharacterized protein n=1 Tax=Yasminevirus sp. GU-2018 TaxID=2420051 RepID=A0A5K0U846_9VIRU|nr:hypothetical protein YASMINEVIRUS_661 [Yasminevirus sp. GU-2018]
MANRYAVLGTDCDDDDERQIDYANESVSKSTPGDKKVTNESSAKELLTIDDIDCGDSKANGSSEGTYYLTGSQANQVSETDNKTINELDVIDDTTLRQRYSELIKTHRHLFTRDRLASLWDSWRAVAPVIPGAYTAKLIQLRSFVLDPDQTELILHDRSPRSRFEYHTLCSALRLEHVSLEHNVPPVIKKEPKVVDEDVGWKVVGRSHKAVKDASNGRDDKKNTDHYPTKYRDFSRKEPGFESFASNKERARYARDAEEKEKLKTMVITKPPNWCWEFTSVSKEQRQIDEEKLRARVEKHKEFVNKLRAQHCTNCNASAVSTALYSSKTLPGFYCELCINDTKFSEHQFKYEVGRAFH